MQIAKNVVVALHYELFAVDGNHPLAGQTLDFSCTVAEVRTATAEEIRHGHVHDGHGHHH